ncbi:MAG: hypothetical protein ACREQJ_01635 [Candidatus Binatia bacterium]
MKPAQAWRGVVLAAAPVLLLLVAANHLYQVRANGMTPWKGGGFGMFSTLDVRFIRVRLLGDSRDRALRIPPEAKEHAAAVREVPTRDRVRELARAVARRLNRSAAQPPGRHARSDVRVEVWRARFEPGRTELHAEKIAEEIVER